MPKGKKTCPECSLELGVRTRICPGCGFDFSSRKKEKPSTEKKEKKNGNGKKEYISPEIAELLKHSEENSYIAPKKLCSDEHADRILSFGKDRAKNLLQLSKGGGWKHVNWKRVEEGINV